MSDSNTNNDTYVVLGGSASFHLPGVFAEPNNSYSRLFGLSEGGFNYRVGSMLISVSISDIIKTFPEPTDLTYKELTHNLSDGKRHCETSDMPIVATASLFLQKRYSEVKWTTGELRKGVQGLIFRGADKVEQLAKNQSTFHADIIEMFSHLLPTPPSETDSDGELATSSEEE